MSVVKANFHYSAGFMFLITFEVRDPYDGLIKPFQARVRHLKHTFTEHVFCRPKPNAGGIFFLFLCICPLCILLLTLVDSWNLLFFFFWQWNTMGCQDRFWERYQETKVAQYLPSVFYFTFLDELIDLVSLCRLE